MYILAPKMYILAPKIYILAPKCTYYHLKWTKVFPFEKVQPQWWLLYLFFWEWIIIGHLQQTQRPL